MRVRRTAVPLALLTLLLGAAPVPSPTPTPPPTIAHVVSRALCTALRVQAGPVIAGLALNDRLTKSAVPVLNRFYNDRYKLKSARADFDITAMRDLAGRMAHNLLTIDNVLATLPTPAPGVSPSADDVKVAALRKQFNDVEDAQRASINIISGLAETEAMADLQNRPNGLGGADGPGGNPAPSPPDGYAGLPMTPAQRAGDPRMFTSGTAVGANSVSPYISALVATDTNVVRREETVSDSVLRAAKECGAQLPPTPSPSP